MKNETQLEEEEYLQKTVIPCLEEEKTTLMERIGSQLNEISEGKKYLWQNIYEMDPIEIAANKASMDQTLDSAENLDMRLFCVNKLLESAFFGRVDFVFDGEDEPDTIYIGVHSLDDQENIEKLIYDWRAPVSSLFYDYEIGAAYYEAPMGKLGGEITLKRQYKIKKSNIEYMFNSSLNIGDEILQKELSSNSDEKMRNIVATIQREQNIIIRNDTNHEMIIQGSAGSGKTSIALHRVAFLLYKHKDTLKSTNILIISPNNVFADYISDVLPELGEEKIMEMSMSDIAENELRDIKFQSFFKQVSALLECDDDDFAARISYKATRDFADRLIAFLDTLEGEIFHPKAVSVCGTEWSAGQLSERFLSMKSVPITKRIDELVGVIAEKVRDNDEKLSVEARNKLTDQLKGWLSFNSLIDIYLEFLSRENHPEMFVRGKAVEYSDVFPLIYIKMWFNGITTFKNIKHLIIDEMQDYTPIQYLLIKKIFTCDFTIIGDANQSVNPYSSTNAMIISGIFPQARCLELKKSYRSTMEIFKLSQKVKPDQAAEPVERHGDEIGFYRADDIHGMITEIEQLCREFKKSDFSSMCIICKTSKQAIQIQKALDSELGAVLIDDTSRAAASGIVITTAHMAKGLEFDYCVIPFADSKNFRTDTDRGMLYISITRAMHKLDLVYTGELPCCLQ